MPKVKYVSVVVVSVSVLDVDEVSVVVEEAAEVRVPVVVRAVEETLAAGVELSSVLVALL